MAKKSNVYKFEIIERVINEVSCENKEDAVALARKMKEVALRNDDYCYFETDKRVMNASNIYLKLSVRGNVYKYYLK